MIKKIAPAKNVAEYIKPFPPAIRSRLGKIRQAIRDAAPEAEELISYNMAGYRLNGMLVYFAGFKNHIGFYPASPGARALEGTAKYAGGKGTLQFPHEQALPLALVKKIVKLRVMENAEKASAKKIAAKK
ncbi:MAG: DUF1801 domain-containing protein [Chitinophagaceae bacterium]